MDYNFIDTMTPNRSKNMSGPVSKYCRSTADHAGSCLASGFVPTDIQTSANDDVLNALPTEPKGTPADDRQLFHNIRADLAAHDGQWGRLGFWAMVVYRYGRWRYTIRSILLRRLSSALYRALYKLVQILTGIDLPCDARIGKNFIIDHHGGIVISGYAIFGDNCRIRNGVVVGLSQVNDPCAPQIGNNVDIGAGAKLLGRIVIGDNVQVGANAVVVRNVPNNSIAVGVPAVIKPRKARDPSPRH